QANGRMRPSSTARSGSGNRSSTRATHSSPWWRRTKPMRDCRTEPFTLPRAAILLQRTTRASGRSRPTPPQPPVRGEAERDQSDARARVAGIAEEDVHEEEGRPDE